MLVVRNTSVRLKQEEAGGLVRRCWKGLHGKVMLEQRPEEVREALW